MLALALTACATSNAMCVVRCVTPASPPCHHHTPAKQKPCDARTNVTPVAIIAAIVCPLEHSATVAPLFLDEDRPAPPSPHPDPPPILRI
jgi:hypothetical protein